MQGDDALSGLGEAWRDVLQRCPRDPGQGRNSIRGDDIRVILGSLSYLRAERRCARSFGTAYGYQPYSCEDT